MPEKFHWEWVSREVIPERYAYSIAEDFFGVSRGILQKAIQSGAVIKEGNIGVLGKSLFGWLVEYREKRMEEIKEEIKTLRKEFSSFRKTIEDGIAHQDKVLDKLSEHLYQGNQLHKSIDSVLKRMEKLLNGKREQKKSGEGD